MTIDMDKVNAQVCRKCGRLAGETPKVKYCGRGDDKDDEHRWISPEEPAARLARTRYLDQKLLASAAQSREPTSRETFLLSTLRKYIQHVVDCEGVSFIDHSGSGDPTVPKFTWEELALLHRLESDVVR